MLLREATLSFLSVGDCEGRGGQNLSFKRRPLWNFGKAFFIYSPTFSKLGYTGFGLSVIP